MSNSNSHILFLEHERGSDHHLRVAELYPASPGRTYDLAEVAAEAPKARTVVVFHSAVLAYVDHEKRAAFAEAVGGLDVSWLSNEAPGVLGWVPAVTESNGFVLVQDGQTVLAETDPHGAWLRWTEVIDA